MRGSKTYATGKTATEAGQTRIRVLVADDHPVVREDVVAMLQTQMDFEVVGASADGIDSTSRSAP